MTLPAVAFDPTDIDTVPATVRKKAFNAAMLALQDSLRAAGYRVDAIAELEVLDEQLRLIVTAFDGTAGLVH